MIYEEKMISIVVPVYNVECYLEKCIVSLINQTYKNIEILLIDDGSKDNSNRICDVWEKKDSRIKVFHKVNGGLSDARNYGIQRASGYYIGFVDSDDWIDVDMYEKLEDACDRNNALIATCGRYKEYPNKQEFAFVLSEQKVMDRKESLKNLITAKYLDFSTCDKLFALQLFQGVSFPKGRLSEDMPVVYHLIKCVDQVVHIGEAKYHYLQRISGIARSLHRNSEDPLIFSKEIYKDVCSNYPEFEKQAKHFVGKQRYNYMLKILRADGRSNESYKRLNKEFVKSFPGLMVSADLPMLEKLKMILLFFRMENIYFYFKKAKLQEGNGLD